MVDYDLNLLLSPLDFEHLSKDLLEAELGLKFEIFRNGRDGGIDLRHAPVRMAGSTSTLARSLRGGVQSQTTIVQCKRYATFSSLKSALRNTELEKIRRLNPTRYLLTTTASLSPQQADELQALLAPHVRSTADIFGRERLNSMLSAHSDVELRHSKLWLGSTGVLQTLLTAGTHVVSREEVERTEQAAKLYVHNDSFREALEILRQHRICIISGIPGIGKTTLARMLMLHFYRRGHDIIKVESDISEARSVAYHSKARYFYYDDFLGQTALADKLNKNEDQKLLDFMSSVRDSTDSVFVLTTREYILNQAKAQYEKLARADFAPQSCIVDLSKYSRRMRAQILYNHLFFSKLPSEYLDSLLAKRGYVAIIDHPNYSPRLIESLTSLTWLAGTSASDYQSTFLRQLTNPTALWEHAYWHQLSSTSQHLLLVLTTLPLEVLAADCQQALLAFTRLQGASPNGVGGREFTNALKELDGTFVSSRAVGGDLLVRFQNPSIRDYMKGVLLDGFLLDSLLGSLTFFEQAQWLLETSVDKTAATSLSTLQQRRAEIATSLRRLVAAPSCTAHVESSYPIPRARRTEASSASRIEVCAAAFGAGMTKEEGEWLSKQLTGLAEEIASEGQLPAPCISLIEALIPLGLLSNADGGSLLATVKQWALGDRRDLEDYTNVARLQRLLPGLFDAGDIDALREAFASLTSRYPEIVEDALSPDDLRLDARKLALVGSQFGVDTEATEDALREMANEMERDEDEGDEGTDWRRETPGVECTDNDLDSMFSTLRDRD
jgi:hypothetical protein